MVKNNGRETELEGGPKQRDVINISITLVYWLHDYKGLSEKYCEVYLRTRELKKNALIHQLSFYIFQRFTP